MIVGPKPLPFHQLFLFIPVLFHYHEADSKKSAGGAMKPVSVYRVDYVRKTKVRIGTVMERRQKDRGDNIAGLLHLARKHFAASPEEAFLTALDWEEARQAQEGGRTRPPTRLAVSSPAATL
jgi:hypothetical protein